MDPIRNPYAPGAGTQPPELAGRNAIRESARIALERSRIGRPTKSAMMLGLRGVGKTVLLNLIREEAEASDIYTMPIEAPENQSLPSILAPRLHTALLKLSRRRAAKELAQRALRGLAGFVKALKVTYRDIEVGLDVSPEPGLADNGNLVSDLQELFEVIGAAAQADATCLAFFFDELQYVPEEQLAALITALHGTSQRRLPVVMLGAGLPQVRGRMGRAKSYAERLFDFSEIGPLSREDAMLALDKPAREEGVEIEPKALEEIVSKTRCYPYFLQEWGKHVWDVTERSPITLSDVEIATRQVVADLDQSFFLVRFDRLSPKEKKYLRAMAQLGAGPHRSGNIAKKLNRRVTSLAPIRSQLINKGMIWSPSHGDTAFTVPMFDEFMRRIMPGDEWLSSC